MPYTKSKSVPERKVKKEPKQNTVPASDTLPGDRKYSIELRLFASDLQPPVFRTIRHECTDRKESAVVAHWNYIVSKRLRLTVAPAEAGLDDLEQTVAEYLQDNAHQSSDDFIQDLARAEVIEVSIPILPDGVGWAARFFPWENALSIVTRRHRKRSLVIVRHLDRGQQNARSSSTTASSNLHPDVLFVRSTPGDFAKSYDFESESALVKFRLQCTENKFRELNTPTKAELAKSVAKTKPDVIHLAVLDTHGISLSEPDLLRDSWSPSTPVAERQEGILLRGESTPYHAVSGKEASEALTDNGRLHPRLISFATCYSATRLAPKAVEDGARTAVGFHELLSNDISEAFFAVFYEEWREQSWDMLKAFRKALNVMWGQPESGRSGVALWSDTSLVVGRTGTVERKGTARLPPAKIAAAILDLNVASVRSQFTVVCEPLQKVNYCSLHNGRDLFTNFSIKKNVPGIVPPVEVSVELSAENETVSWRQSLVFGDSPGSESLGGRVRVPLGSRSLRRVQESTRSNLFVEVRCGPHTLLRQSQQVTLLPVDEWRDTDEDRRWLPSFVLPRDPAIRRIMTAADRYLRALSDDSGAGFDGYQQSENWPDIVDLQARAIWCALIYDFRLRYINPPPTYTQTENGISQRLRTPTQIIEEGRGTCIDLALLFAGCLEYIGVYPVIFLISGHAFPGWWRNEKAYQEFAGFTYSNVVEGREEELAKKQVTRDEYAQWMVTGTAGFRELVIPLRKGGLAALESTMLCSYGAFEEALHSGRENLTDSSIFDALINVQRAREGDNPVTPLPIVGGMLDASPAKGDESIG